MGWSPVMGQRRTACPPVPTLTLALREVKRGGAAGGEEVQGGKQEVISCWIMTSKGLASLAKGRKGEEVGDKEEEHED